MFYNFSGSASSPLPCFWGKSITLVLLNIGKAIVNKALGKNMSECAFPSE